MFFAEIMHAGRAAIDMKHIKQDFRGGGPRPKLNFFRIQSCCISNYS